MNWKLVEVIGGVVATHDGHVNDMRITPDPVEISLEACLELANG